MPPVKQYVSDINCSDSNVLGMKGQLATFAPEFTCQMQTLQLRVENFKLVAKVTEVGELTPSLMFG